MDVEGLWDRLRRRKVVQWGLAYVAPSWAVNRTVAMLLECAAAWRRWQGLEHETDADGPCRAYGDRVACDR
jgi:hypothetical protein